MQQQPLFNLDEYIVSPQEDADPPNIFAVYFGEEAAEKIIESYGGQDLKVPSQETGPAFERVVKNLGKDLAERFVRTFGGEFIYVPQEAAVKIKERNVKICEKVKALMVSGSTNLDAMSAVAEEFKISQRSIRRIFYG